jgi:hypothetical protein
MEKKTLCCEACGASFVWSVAEQQHFARFGFQQPKRCHPCRRRRQEERDGRGGGTGVPLRITGSVTNRV